MSTLRKEYKTINGELIVYVDDNTLVAEFHRAIDQKIVHHFIKAIKDFAPSFNGQKWQYISYSLGIEAATADSEDLLLEAVIQAVKLGCETGVYVATSKIAIAQMDRILKRAGVPDGIAGRVFTTIEDAKRYLNDNC